MRKLFYNVKKELLILMRDIPGMAILFLMPLLLIIVITLTQQNAISSVNGNNIEILFLDHDQNSYGKMVREGLQKCDELMLIEKYHDSKLTDSLAENLVEKGKFKAAVIIEESTTEKTKEKIIRDIKNLIGGEKEDETTQVSGIRILFDPAIKDIVKTSIINAVKMAKTTAESSLMTTILFYQLPEVIKTDDPSSQEILSALQQVTMSELPHQIVNVKESFPENENRVIKSSITQNNVPAFALFAMFFIVIPLAGSLITEKNEGTYDRIRILPVSRMNILMGKTLAYLIVCFFQFILMVLVGIYVFPYLLHLPALDLGTNYLGIFFATVISALSAIGFGLLVGTFASTHNQAAMFGAILVVIMASLGGIFMPVYMMPENLKIISFISPLRWGVDSYLDLFSRGSGLTSIWQNLLLLLGFYIVSIWVAAKRF